MRKSKSSGHADGSSENGQSAANGTAPAAASSSSGSLLSQRWCHILCLSVAVLIIAFEIMIHGDIELESTIVGVRMGTKDSSEGSYEPLVGTKGKVFEMINNKNNDKNGTLVDANDNNNEGGSSPGGNNPSLPLSESMKHPRMACFLDNNKDLSNCQSLLQNDEVGIDPNWPDAIPKKIATATGKGDYESSSSSDFINVRADETKECQLSDPSYQAKAAAPATCNDVHSLPFRFGPTEREPLIGIPPNSIYPSRHQIKYLTSGGFRSVWTVTQLLNDIDEEEDRVILKTNMLRRGWSAYYLDQNRRDILISERAGSSPLNQPLHSNVLPIYQYCAFSSIVPFSTAGPLDTYVNNRANKRGDDGKYHLMSAEEQFMLGLQAARGLYQMGLYKGGKATVTHADVKPPQFLLFDRPQSQNQQRNKDAKDSINATTTIGWEDVPILQLNDFNRGRFMTRSKTTNETCPFTMCHVKHKGSTYRSPEEYLRCANQTDKIDVFSLGGVFYYLLSDGERPWYHLHSFDEAVKQILDGRKPRLPDIAEEYGSYSKAVVEMVRERAKHPAYVALKEVMIKCWAFKAEERPSSWEVVQMLEEKWSEIQKVADERNRRKR